jgi:phosphate transport system permease protein
MSTLQGSRRHRVPDLVVAGLALCSTLVCAAILVCILAVIGYNARQRLDWEFVTAAPRAGMMEGGIFPAIFGTVALVLIMTVAVVPVGVASAVWLHEYASPDSRLARLVRGAVHNLAGVPSIVFGLFGLGFFVRFLGHTIDTVAFDGDLVYGQPALVWAALTLAVLTLPVVIVSTEEALRTVPIEMREASLALGATRFQTILKVVLPQASAGILTGTILAVSRGAGEVAPILVTGAAYFLPYLPTALNDQFMHLGYHILVLSTQSPDVEKAKPLLFATVAVLLLLTFALNAMAVTLRARMRRKLA